MGLRQLNLILLSLFLLGAAPSRTQTYTNGEVISPTEVTENEDNIFSYLQAGVDTYRTNSIASSAFQDASVTETKLATDAVTAGKIKDGEVGTAEIATDGVSAAEIAAGAVGTSEIATDGVEAAEIAAGAVGTSEIATDGVAAAEIAAGAVGASELASGAVDVVDMATTGTAADDKAFIADSSSAGTWRTVTDCTDTTGQHLNYTQSTNSFSCGTTDSTNSPVVGSFSKNMADASGTQTVSGLGITPTAVIVSCSQSSTAGKFSAIGFSNSTTDGSQYDQQNETASSWSSNSTYAIVVLESSTAFYQGDLGNFVSGAFDIVWTRTSTPTGTMTCEYMAW